MKDLIDEKNRQAKMKRSIIKYWNVPCMVPRKQLAAKRKKKSGNMPPAYIHRKIMSMTKSQS